MTRDHLSYEEIARLDVVGSEDRIELINRVIADHVAAVRLQG